MSYTSLFALPKVARLVLAVTASRLPVGVNPLAIVLLVYEVTGSFGDAGLATGAFAAGTAVGQPLLGRLVDALGNRPMVPVAVLQVASVAGIVLAVANGAPAATLAALALMSGLALAPTTSVLRGSWPRLVGGRAELLPSAYAIDAVLVQLSFMLGPLLVVAMASLASPQVALVAASLVALIGTMVFVGTAPAEPAASTRDRSGRGLLGPLTLPTIRVLALSQVPVGIAFGSLQIVLPAFAEEQGDAGQAGALLALVALASIVGALVYGARRRHRPVHDVHRRLAMLVPVGFIPAVAAWSLPSMALFVLPAGALLAAFFATRNELAAMAAPPGHVSESVTWPLTALIVGSSLGAGVAGLAVEAAGWRWAAVIAVVAAAVGALVVTRGRVSFASPIPRVPEIRVADRSASDGAPT